MAVSLCELNGARVTDLALTLPAAGRWTADAALDVDGKLVARGEPVVLILGGLSLVGRVYRAGNLYGRGRYRIFGGLGDWGKVLPPKAYQNPPGLRLKPILEDAARAAGEQVVVQRDRLAGFFYSRPRGPASRSFALARPDAWWVRPDGVTEVGERAAPAVASDFDVFAESDFGRGRILVATDKPEDWPPGCRFSSPSFSGTKQASAVVHRLTPKRFRTEVWTAP